MQKKNNSIRLAVYGLLRMSWIFNSAITKLALLWPEPQITHYMIDGECRNKKVERFYYLSAFCGDRERNEFSNFNAKYTQHPAGEICKSVLRSDSG